MGHITNGATIEKFREPGRDANEVQIARDEAENGCFIASAQLDDCQLVPSTKLTATMIVLATWLQDHPDDKVIGTYFQIDGSDILLTPSNQSSSSS